MQRPGTPCRRAMTASGSIRVILPLFLAAVSVPACDAWMGPAPAGGLALSRVRGVCAMKTVMHSVVSLRASSAVAERQEDDPDDVPAEDRVWPAKESRDKAYRLARGEVAVRFINTPGRFPSDGSNDVIAAAMPGDVLMAVGDSVGVALPRGCMTGLCGACTADVEDPAAGPGSRSILRACSSKVALPEGCDELVIDCYRMLTKSGKKKANPMERFAAMDDPKTGFKAQWDLPDTGTISTCSACGEPGVNSKGAMPEDCSLAPGCPFGKKK
mmetsp:Transcript_35905/g.85363  ORF Transcript_35905/g.85363 Transcript_35905/m.85363 type:complete len:271 (-) Transcript_35905:139-951(-)